MADKRESYWESQIDKGLTWRKKYSREKDWDRFALYYEHIFEHPRDPHFNLIYMLCSSAIPALVFQSPGILNTSRRPEYLYWARFFDGLDNWLVSETETKEILEEAVLDAFLANVVGIELNYDWPNERENPTAQMEFSPVENTLNRTRKTNQPWIDKIEARKLLLAPGTTTMRNCRWYAKNVMVPTKLLKGMRGLIKGNVKATHLPSQVRGTGEDIAEQDPEREYTSVWIIHEAENQTWMWLTSDGKFIVAPERDLLQVDGLPLHLLTFNRGKRSIWGVPDAAYVETQQIDGDESRYAGRIQSKAANVKAFYDSNLLDEEQIVQFITSKALGCIPVNIPPDKSLRDVLALVQPHVQGERFQYNKELLNDAQLVIGQGPNQFGTFAPGRRTKFEAQIVEERNYLRTGARRAKIATIIGKLYEKINQLIVREWKAPTVQQVVGREGAIYWVKALPKEFGNFRAQLVTKVNVESLAPVSRERRKQEMIEVMSVIAKLSRGLEGVNLMPLVQSFLSQFEWADVTNTLPMAQQQGPLDMQTFQQQQQAMTPETLQGALQANLGGLNSIIQQLPQRGGTTGGQQ